jgi:hypothetical protein
MPFLFLIVALALAPTVIALVLLNLVDLGPFYAFDAAVGGLAGAGAWVAASIRWAAHDLVEAEPDPASATRRRYRIIQPYPRGRVFADIRGHWRAVLHTGRRLLGWTAWLGPLVWVALWPGFAILLMWWLAAAAALAALATAFTAVALAVTGAWRLLWMAVTPLLRLAHRRHRHRTGGVVCTNGKCLRAGPRPAYDCGRDCDARLDRYPSAAGVLWTRDRHGHRRSTLPFLGRAAPAYCPYCGRALGKGADRDAHRQILVTGASEEGGTAFVTRGLRQLLESSADGPKPLAAALGRAATPLVPGGPRPDTVAIRLHRMTGTPIRLHCKVAAAEYLDTVEASRDLPAFDECHAAAFVIQVEQGRVVEPDRVRQRFNVLRQRLPLNRDDPRRVKIALVLSGAAADPEALSDLDPLRSALAAESIRHRWFSDDREAWRWLLSGSPRRVEIADRRT